MKCSVCHDELVDPNGVCQGRLPGAVGLVAFSPGPCLSTPDTRAEVDKQRREAAARETERKS